MFLINILVRRQTLPRALESVDPALGTGIQKQARPEPLCLVCDLARGLVTEMSQMLLWELRGFQMLTRLLFIH